jgi:hypothetical protein
MDQNRKSGNFIIKKQMFGYDSRADQLIHRWIETFPALCRWNHTFHETQVADANLFATVKAETVPMFSLPPLGSADAQHENNVIF